jgi:glyoxylase-like metal-dependent hydrolase (beta-lactamase superfamily II)
MKRVVAPLFAAVVLSLAGAGAGDAVAQRGPAAPPLVREGATEKIADHVYLIPDNNVGMVPNVGIVVGSRGTLVIDTGMGARNGQTIVREMQQVSKTPELYLASTHIHPEHDLGAGGFPPQTKMIRSRNQIDEIATDGMQTAKRFAGFSPLNAELLEGADFRKADITFDKEHVLDLGGVRVRIVAMGYNHTRGDQAFFIEPDAVLFSGDIVMSALPNVGAARPSQWLASFDAFDALKPKRVVGSHGPMGDGAMISAARGFLLAVRASVAQAKKQGKSQAEAEAAVTAELSAKFPAAGGRLTSAIRAAFTEAP